MNAISAAHQLLRDYGWVKGAWENGGGHCMARAIYRVTHDQLNMLRGGLPYTWSPGVSMATLAAVIREQYPDRRSGHVPQFNDDPATTWADVESVMEKAALRLDEQGA